MKVRWNGLEIDCTPDEFEDLYTRGVLTNKDTPEEALGKVFISPDAAPSEKKDLFPTVAVYGCYMGASGFPPTADTQAVVTLVAVSDTVTTRIAISKGTT